MPFLLHWGKKQVEKREGFVADFCPICRGFRAFRLTRIGRALAFNEVPLSQGTLVGHVKTCCECGLRSWVSDGRYRGSEPRDERGLEFLIERTLPGLAAEFAQRLGLEEELKRGRLDYSSCPRQELLMEPFKVLTPMVDEFFQGPARVDAPSGLACLGTLAVTLGLFIFSSVHIRGPAQDRALVGVGLVLLLGIAFSLYQLHRVPFRRVKRQAVPLAARALRPLQPSRREIEECLRQCGKSWLGKAMKPDHLWAKLQIRGSQMPSPMVGNRS
jgi:hypothetical protein